MRYCNRCKVIIENALDECPLCKQKNLKIEGIPESDFPIQRVNNEDKMTPITKILVFMFIFLIGINVILNLIFSFKFIWAPYSIVVLFYIYLLVKAAMKSYKNLGTIVVINVYMLSIIGFILDIILGFSRWSVNYLIPILVLSGIIALVIFVIIKPVYFLSYFIYVLIIATFGLTLLILLWTNILTIKTPSIIAAFISLMTIIGMFMFGDKSAKNEFIKRFHF